MDCKARLETYLREQQVSFQVHHHPLTYTAQEVAAVEHVPGKLVAKVVVVYAGDRPVMLVVPAPYRIDFEQVRATLGASQVRLASETELKTLFPDCEVGAMPPFGNLYQVPVYVDRALTDDETIVFQAGTHTDTMRLAYADFARLVQPTIATFAYHADKLAA